VKKLIFLLFCFENIILYAQPYYFTWKRPDSGNNKGYNYISPAKNQGEQSPCKIFAAVAAVEAMSHIYYNKPFPISSSGIDLAERELYSWCSGYGGPNGSATIEESLNYIDINGLINESCFPYPTAQPYYTDCSTMCSTPGYEVNIPGFEQLNLTSPQSLKRAIIDYGPIATYLAHSGYELHGSAGDENHAVLIIGWDGSQWHIKDSWPGDYWIDFKTINLFDSQFQTQFYRVKYENNGNLITCTGNDCSSVFGSRSCTDTDGDGFYYWGIGPKPAGCAGPCKMDFNDNDITKIFLNSDYVEVNTPTITGPEYVCSGTGGYFEIHDVPTGFNLSWAVSPSYYFNNPVSDTSTSVTLYPKAQYTGECTLTYTLSDNVGSVQYSKKFFINAPNQQQISINVVQSYAYPPILNGSVWLLCPNSSYYIYLNNSSGCSTSNYQWNIPSGWTLYEQSQNYIRINTNSTPSAVLTVNATTCCNNSYLIKTQYFGQSYSCGGYFMVYPNPASTEVNIELTDEVDLSEINTSIEIYDANYNKELTIKEMQKQLKISTDGLNKGFHYVLLRYKGQKYTQKVKIEK
jgi:hypothetical protein